MKNVLHDWEDDICVGILKNIVRVMQPSARLLVIDAIVDDKNRGGFSKILDLQMLTGTSGGRERSREEFKTLFVKAGLQMLRTINTATPFYFIESRLA